MLRKLLALVGLPVLVLGTALVAEPSQARAGVGFYVGVGRGYYGYPGFYPGYVGYPGYSPYYGAGYYGRPYWPYTTTYYPYTPYYSYIYRPDPYMYTSSYIAAPQPLRVADSEVLLNVRVPANATVWVNGKQTSKTGASREFISSDLTPGKSYTYVLRAEWTQDGKKVERTENVKVQGGERRMVDFLAAAGN